MRRLRSGQLYSARLTAWGLGFLLNRKALASHQLGIRGVALVSGDHIGAALGNRTPNLTIMSRNHCGRMSPITHTLVASAAVLAEVLLLGCHRAASISALKGAAERPPKGPRSAAGPPHWFFEAAGRCGIWPYSGSRPTMRSRGRCIASTRIPKITSKTIHRGSSTISSV
jgi:hypothetical protein